MYDPTPEKLASLRPEVQERAYWMIYAARQAGVPLMVISGFRSTDLNRAVGGAVNSLHLQGRAFDVQVAGYAVAEIAPGWWRMLGEWAKVNLGLGWGGDFRDADVNHFYL